MVVKLIQRTCHKHIIISNEVREKDRKSEGEERTKDSQNTETPMNNKNKQTNVCFQFFHYLIVTSDFFLWY